MSRRRQEKRTKVARPGHDRKSRVGVPREGAGRAPEPSPQSDPREIPLTTLFVALLIAYGVWFYQVAFTTNLVRYQPLAFLIVPGDLAVQWFGGSMDDFALFDRLRLAAVAVGVGFVGWSLGQLLLHWLQVADQWEGAERCALALGTGLSGVSTVTLALGWAGWLRSPSVFWVSGLVIVAAAHWRLLGPRAPLATDERVAGRTPPLSRSESLWQRYWWWLAVPFVAVILLGAALPSIDFDVLEYHLQVPKEWVGQGRVTFLPHNVYGNMPLGAEMLVTLAMTVMPGELHWWWGGLAGKIVMALFAPLTAVLIYAAGRRYFGGVAGAVGALVFISTPWVVQVSVSGLNEAVVGFYLFAALYAARRWWDLRSSCEPRSRGMLVLSGLLAGSAVACKYTAVVFVVLPLGVLVLWGASTGRVRAVIWFSAAVTLACGLWLAKNWVVSGNPTYPLLVNVFGGETRTLEKDQQWRRAHQVPRDVAGRRYTPQQAWQSLRQLAGKSLWHSPLIVPLASLLLLRRDRWRQAAFWVGMLGVILATWWLVTHRIDRFWVPAVPLMALAAGVGADWSNGRWWRSVRVGVVLLGLLANFVLAASPLPGDNRYFVSLEQLRDDPRLSYIPVAQRYLNEHVPAGSRALMVGDAAAFELRVPVLYNTCFDDCQFERLLSGFSADERRTRLIEQGISHIWIDWSKIRRYREPGNYGYSEFVTPELVHGELVRDQRLLRPVPVPGLAPETGEVFEVVAD